MRTAHLPDSGLRESVPAARAGERARGGGQRAGVTGLDAVCRRTGEAAPDVASEVFAGSAGQVRAVRAFVRDVLAGHAAVDDAVLVASELGTNAVAHSFSGLEGGRFAVHVAGLSPDLAAVVVTDQGAAGRPRIGGLDQEAESGRGLAVVRCVSSELLISGGCGGPRSVLAVIPARPPGR